MEFLTYISSFNENNETADHMYMFNWDGLICIY